jgi:hypothetical protein
MRILIMAAAAALATACASQTPLYQSRDDGGRYGYAELQLEPNRIRVTYNGDTLTARETVETYLLYRAAETTLQRGFDYFIVTSANIEEDSEYQDMGGAGPRMRGASFHEVSRHNAAADILMFEGEKPASLANAYDARAVQQSLEQRIIQRPAAY